MRPCRRIRKKLSAYQDGEIDAGQKEAIEAHLHTCEACRQHYAQLQVTCQMLKRLPDIEAGANLSLEILDRVSQAQASLWQRSMGRLFRRLPVPAAVVALAAAGIWVGVLVGHFWIEQVHGPFRKAAAFQSDPALTIAALKAFDATPPGSIAASYLLMTTYSPETGHAK
jgi:anti-sigma factor RsiW